MLIDEKKIYEDYINYILFDYIDFFIWRGCCNFFEIEINFSVIKNLLKGKFLKLRNVFKV